MYPRVLDVVGDFHIIRTSYTFGTLCACFAPTDRMTCWFNNQGTAIKTGQKVGMI